MNKQKRLIIIILLIITSIFTLSSCDNESTQTCQHQWCTTEYLYPEEYSICSIKRVCSICGNTDQLTLDKHNYQNGKCSICNKPKVARIFGKLTYDYHDSIYNDSFATVMLIPNDHNVKTYDNYYAVMLLSGRYDSGIMVTKCNSQGNFDFGKTIPLGWYDIVVISNRTFWLFRDSDDDLTNEIAYRNNYKSYFFKLHISFDSRLSTVDLEKLCASIGYSNYYLDNLIIENDNEIEFSYTFEQCQLSL